MNMQRRRGSHRVRLKRVYTRADVDGIAHIDSMPGEAPFVRGPFATMYTQKPWTIRQYAGYAQASDTNLAFRTALAEGAQGLSVAFDLPTQRGYDSDDPAVSADVGMTGVAIDTVEDMTRLFEDIALDRVSVSMTINGAVLPVLAAFIVAAEESGVSASQLRGTIQNDILKEFMVRNTSIFAPEPSLRIAADVVEYLSENVPRFNALSVSGYHFQEAGADPVLELALTMANARKYVTALVGRGMQADDVCQRMSFFFGVGMDFYAEIGKLRAARILWSDIASASGATSDRARALRMHCQTSGWSLTAQKPMNNVVRTTVEALAAVFGGTQSLHTNGYDEALSLPCAEASSLARDTQLVLQHETGLCDVVDPWAGSYMMENLTAEICREALTLMAEIERRGGVIDVVESGWVREQIHRSALNTQAEIETGKRTVVGVNNFMTGCNEDLGEPQAVDGRRVRVLQTQRLAHIKARRDPTRVRDTLDALTRAAQSRDGNLLELTVACMRARATVGECTQALEAVWPRYRIGLPLSRDRYGAKLASDEDWQNACRAVADATKSLGRAPRVLIAKLGQDGHDRGARIVAAALSDAGFAVSAGSMFASPSDTAVLAGGERVDVIGVSSLAGAQNDLIAALREQLTERGLRIPIVVGGIIGQASQLVLQRSGVAACFPAGTPIKNMVPLLAAIAVASAEKRVEGSHPLHETA
ncbi:methylmalonyl-CoA mutase [Paraburkholderia phymatum]|uniref:Methylmalonyl-CoA mutase n=1 Tax=Paraburkholderia phymatum (strain DSM 17167 / CIP 108236 / LMG 21445 / STM815) TaxID=391038 RepID=B2JQZ0_PARP8|nr:methylmalonyl-CoA mutase [Paraburkholderia phymatum]ACC73681.1 methylmalonyl-CoA mutase, large subunit [Paraburkholderia phymatum STM815]